MLIHMPIFVTFLFLRWMRVKHFRPCKVSPLSQERKKLVKFTPLSIIRVPLCYKQVWVEGCESFCLAPIQVRYEVPTQFGQSGQSKVYKKSPSGQDCSCIGYLPLFGHPQLCHQMVSQHTRPPNSHLLLSHRGGQWPLVTLSLAATKWAVSRPTHHHQLHQAPPKQWDGASMAFGMNYKHITSSQAE